MVNPLVPPVYDVVWSLALVCSLALLVVALIQIARVVELSSTAREVWVLIVLAAPIVGPIACLL